MKYPTVAEVIAADEEQISFWRCFLQDPETLDEERLMDLIFKKFYANGGDSRRKSGRKSDERHPGDASLAALSR